MRFFDWLDFVYLFIFMIIRKEMWSMLLEKKREEEKFVGLLIIMVIMLVIYFDFIVNKYEGLN